MDSCSSSTLAIVDNVKLLLYMTMLMFLAVLNYLHLSRKALLKTYVLSPSVSISPVANMKADDNPVLQVWGTTICSLIGSANSWIVSYLK